MEAPPIPYTRPYMPPGAAEAVAEVVREGRLVMGERVKAFEASVARFTGRAFAVAVTSGTSALELALRAKGVGPGFHVFVPAYTWVATYNVPLLVGATPVLVDVDPATYCMDVRSLREAMDRTRGAPQVILPVHLFGYRALRGMYGRTPGEGPEIVIGDGCCAFGGRDEGDGEVCGAWTPVVITLRG
jgi:dTDP-4-amino-4,6-dideoxygalactose transaminase